jgi:flavin-binding protein dodecin
VKGGVVPEEIPGAVVKVIELVGSSPNSFSDAVRNAVKTASKSLRHIRGVEVLNSTADVDDGGGITNYKVHCKVAFVIEGSEVGS